jgi:hypothetical protein
MFLLVLWNSLYGFRYVFSFFFFFFLKKYDTLFMLHVQNIIVVVPHG